MDSFFALLLNTILLRPYVFIFLLVYLLGCSLQLGAKRALLFMVAGYVITWISEYSSIHTGLPYGLYYYIDRTKDLELWVFGVPFMDSLSYTFLAYASYSLAIVTQAPVICSGKMLYCLETRAIRNSLLTTFLGAIFLVYLDIIIDPVALQGSRWFLGQIYGYSEKGAYFGVPISNFIGWLAVGMILIFTLQKIDSYLESKGVRDINGLRYPWRYLIGPGLYLGVLAFNLSVTFYIGEYTMGWVGIFIIMLPLILIFSAIKLKLSRSDHQIEIERHVRDFPEAEVFDASGRAEL